MNRLTWPEIVHRYPCQWMMLAEPEDDDHGNLAYARVLDHDRSALTFYVTNHGGPVRAVRCDGVDRADHSIPLQDDRREHRVEIELGGT